MLTAVITVTFAALSASCFYRSMAWRRAGLRHSRCGTVVGEPGAIAVGLRRGYEKRGDPEPYWALATLEMLGGPFWIRTRAGTLALVSVEGVESLALDVPEGDYTSDPVSSRRRYRDRVLTTGDQVCVHASGLGAAVAPSSYRGESAEALQVTPAGGIVLESKRHSWSRRARRVVWVLAGVSAATGAATLTISAWLLAQLLLTAVLIGVATYLQRDTHAGR